MLLSFIIGIAVGLDALSNNNEKESYVGFSIMVLGIVLLIFFNVGMNKCYKSDWNVSDKPYAVEKIISLNDNNMTNGRFYMRRGYIESNLYYQYIVDLGNGGYKANKVRSDNATLYFTDDDYRVEWYTKTKKWLYFERGETIHKIYIPEGSITDEYSVDLR